MSDCNKEEENWSILYYAYEDFNRENPIVEHFPTKEAAEKRSKEVNERRRKLAETLELIVDKLALGRMVDNLDRIDFKL